MTMPTNKNLLSLVLLIFALPAFADDNLPTEQGISDITKKAKQTYDSFFTQTFEIRMQYEYSGRFLNPQDKDTFRKAAQQVSADLEQIANTQAAMKKEIESYQKDDWETLFGQTGLWRKLAADLLNTQAGKLEIDYCLARLTGNLKFDQQFFDTLAKSGLSPCASIKASLEKIKSLGLSEPKELNEIFDSITKSDCGDNSELLLGLAILQNKLMPDKLTNTLSQSSKVRESFSKLIFNDICSGSDLNSLNPITAELVAAALWENKPNKYKELLLAIANNEKLKTSATIGIAGIALAESEPAKAIEWLMEASKMQVEQKKTILNFAAGAFAEHAVRIAFVNFKNNKIDCNLALAAFDNLNNVPSEPISEQMQYIHGQILSECGKIPEAAQIFAKLAETSKDIYCDKASLELLKIKTDSGSVDTLPELQNFILNNKGQDEQNSSLRREALDLYCRKSLAHDTNEYASRVIAMFDKAEYTPGLQYDLYKAQSLYRLGRLEESARYMSKAIVKDSGSMAPVAAHIVSDIVDKIELWQKDANDFNELLRNCYTLAEFAHKSANTTQTNLLLAEVTILEGEKIDWPLPSNDEGALWPRVQARLLMAQEKYEQSAKSWAQIGELQRNEAEEQNQKSYGWWQAKFYELDCLAKSPAADRQNIAHVIDVLTGSNPQIPAPWAEKLDLLKKQCAAN